MEDITPRELLTNILVGDADLAKSISKALRDYMKKNDKGIVVQENELTFVKFDD